MLRRTHKYPYLTAHAMAASFSGPVINVEDRNGFSVLAAWTETVAALGGTLKLQASNNYDFQNPVMLADPEQARWTDITGSPVTAAGAGSYGWNVSDVYYSAARLVWVSVTGTGSISADVCVKD